MTEGKEGHNYQESVSELADMMMQDPRFAVKKVREHLDQPKTSENGYKFQGAVLNQALARVYLLALDNPQSEGDRYRVVNLVLAISRRMTEEKALDVRRMLNGARAQAGLVKYLRDFGWTVVLPDSMDEVWGIEISGESDFVGVNEEGGMYFIDVKSRHYADGPNSSEKMPLADVLIEKKSKSGRQTASLLSVINPALSKAGVVLNPRKIQYGFFCVTLPGLKEYIDQKTGCLNEQIGESVINRLEKENLSRWI